MKDKLLNKTPLECAANDHIKELMIAYCSPQYMPDEKSLVSKKDFRVNKKGQVVQEEDLNLEPPLKSQPVKKTKKSLVKPKTAQEPDTP